MKAVPVRILAQHSYHSVYKRGDAGDEEHRMLVLSRKKNESIVINDDITIVVVEIRGDKVRLGVEAPREVPVHRREVFEAIRRNEAASKEDQAKPDSAPAPGEE
jgi:carbon storage regulator